MRSVIRISSCIWLALSVPTGVRFSCPSLPVLLVLLLSMTVLRDVPGILVTFCGLIPLPLWLLTVVMLNVVTLMSFTLGSGSLVMELAMISN